jgi:hypothetical protein
MNHPGGRKKPNDLGMFDMHGNAAEWVQDEYRPKPKSEPGKVIGDSEDIEDIDDSKARVMRSFGTGSSAESVDAVTRFSRGAGSTMGSAWPGSCRLTPLLLYLLSPRRVRVRNGRSSAAAIPVGIAEMALFSFFRHQETRKRG